jgi:uncharacterized protein (DUF885 family)
MKIGPRMLLAGVVMSAACAVSAQAATTTDVPTRVKALNALLAEQWQHTLEVQPEFATILGDLRYNDRWSNVSPAFADSEYAADQAFLKRFQAIDTTGFSEEDKLNQELMVRRLSDALKAHELKVDEMPLEQMSGVHLQLAGFISSIPFDNTKEYDDYLKRLKAVPALFDQATETARLGLKNGMMPPKYLLEKVVTQIDSIGKPAGMDSVFAEPLKHFPKTVSAADQKRLHDAILAAIDQQVRPAYAKLGAFVKNDYAPHGRSEPGVWQLPNGDAIYAFQVEQMTTTKESPERIHEIGLSEVKRIEGEMTVIAKSQGFKDLASVRDSLKTNPKGHAT